MKILIVSDTLLEGGAEIFSLRLCTSLNNKGIDVTLLSMNAHYENKQLTSVYDHVTIKRIRIPFPYFIEKVDHLLFRLGVDLSIKSYLQRKQVKKFIKDYDIVHTNFIRTDFLFSQLKKDYSFKHIVTVHGDYSDYYYRKKEERVDWLKLEKKLEIIRTFTDQFVVVSDEQQRFFEQVLKCNTVIKIYNGFESLQKESNKEPRTCFTIGMMGRGHRLKGWETVLKLFKYLPEDCELFLAGDSEYLNELKQQYKEERRIHFLGYCDDIGSFYNKLDLFVLPTLFQYESLPTVIIESLYFGVPVIATDVGEIANMLQDEESNKKAGYLLDKIDNKINIDQLKEQILYLYNNPTVLNEMRETSRKAFMKFDMNVCVDKYIQLYSRVVNH